MKNNCINGLNSILLCLSFLVYAPGTSAEKPEDIVCGLGSTTFRVANDSQDAKHAQEGAEVILKVFLAEEPTWQFTDEASKTSAEGHFYGGANGCDALLLYGVATISDDNCEHAVFLEGNADWSRVNVKFSDLKSQCGEHLPPEPVGSLGAEGPIRHNGQVHWVKPPEK